MILATTVRWSLLRANLPVSSHVDERTAMDVLQRFDEGRLDPGFFRYPTLYFYSTWFSIQPFGGYERALLLGRFVNLLFGLVLAGVTYACALDLSGRRVAALFAAALALFSPILVHSASYLGTDVLLGAFSVAAVIFLRRFQREGRSRDFVLAALAAALAFSTKYTGLVLLATIVIADALGFAKASDARPPTGSFGRFLRAPVPLGLLRGLALAGGALALLLTFVDPAPLLASLVAAATTADAGIDAQAAAWIDGLRRGLPLVAAGLVLAVAASFPLRKTIRRLVLGRHAFAVGLAGLVFLLTSPYALLSWRTFLHDFGSELKANALLGEHAQWFAYLGRYLHNESVTVAALALIGAVLGVRRGLGLGTPAVFLAMMYVAIGSATRGFERYLVPLLPVIYALAALGLSLGWERLANRSRALAALAAAGVLALIAVEFRAPLGAVLERADMNDEMRQCYYQVLERAPRKVYYAGFAPSRELEDAGFPVEAVARRALGEVPARAGPLLGEGEFLIVDSATERMIEPGLRGSLEEVWQVGGTWGQHILRAAPGTQR